MDRHDVRHRLHRDLPSVAEHGRLFLIGKPVEGDPAGETQVLRHPESEPRSQMHTEG